MARDSGARCAAEPVGAWWRLVARDSGAVAPDIDVDFRLRQAVAPAEGKKRVLELRACGAVALADERGEAARAFEVPAAVDHFGER